MKIVVSLATAANNTERRILRAMHRGIVEHYRELQKLVNVDMPEVVFAYDIPCPKCDVAVQFGGLKDRSAEHHQARYSVKENARSIVYVETPLLGRRINEKNLYDYYRVGFGGFLNHQGYFCPAKEMDEARLDTLFEQELIQPFPGWKDPSKGAILVLTQLPGDSSLRGQKMSEWLLDTLEGLRAITDREILVRLHPAMSIKGRQEFLGEIATGVLLSNYQNITWLPGHTTTLQEDLERSGVCINYTSGSSIDAVLAGVPVIAMDQGNFAYDISSNEIEDLLDPRLASDEEITYWLVRLANSQWTLKEIAQGRPWNLLEPTILEKLG